jgi:hypothetical protein
MFLSLFRRVEEKEKKEILKKEEEFFLSEAWLAQIGGDMFLSCTRFLYISSIRSCTDSPCCSIRVLSRFVGNVPLMRAGHLVPLAAISFFGLV